MDEEQRWEKEGVMTSSPAPQSPKHAGQPRFNPVPKDGARTVVKTGVRTYSPSPRDVQIIAFAGRFGQVTGKHISRRFFGLDRPNSTVKDQLTKLVKHRLLSTVEIRTVGGRNGGSGQFVYQVGVAGWKLSNINAAFYQSKVVKYHSLAIADVFTDIDSRLDVITYDTEPDTHEKINYVLIEPDLYVKFDMGDSLRHAWLEIDLGTERPRQLRDKMARYHHAWLGASEKWRQWPRVVWVAETEKRKAELESLIAQEPKESQPMYRVTLFGDVVETLTS